MKKIIISMVIIISLLIVSTSSIAQPANNPNTSDNDTYIIYTVNRPNRFMARNMRTGEINVLFETQVSIIEFRVVGEYIFVLSGNGIYRFDKQGNGGRIIEDRITAFDVDEYYIYYAVGTSPFTRTRIMRSYLNGNNITMLAEERVVNKLTAVNGGVIYNNLMTVGKITDTGDHFTFTTNFSGYMMGVGEPHFVVNDKIIIAGLVMLERSEEWHRTYITIILDLDGNVVNVWDDKFVNNIGESNGKIYANITTYRRFNAVGETVEAFAPDAIGMESFHNFYYITNDFNEKRRVIDDSNIPNFLDMYVSENSIYFVEDLWRNSYQWTGIWTRWDIMPDGTLENRAELADHRELYPYEIQVILHDRSVRQGWQGNMAVEPFSRRTLSFDTPPIIENGRTLVPFRGIFEALEMEVDWNDDTRTAIGTSDDITIELPIDSTTATVNGEAVTLDVPAMLYNARTMVPLRFIAESTGADVDWCDDTRTVTISIN